MNDSIRSPRRQQILSGFNPEDPHSRSPSPERRRRRSPKRAQEGEDDASRPQAPVSDHEDGGDPTTKPRRSRLKLKDEKSRRKKHRHRDRSASLSRPSRHDRPRERSHRERDRSRSRSRSTSPSRASRHHHSHRDRSPSRRHRHRHRHHRSTRTRSPTPPNPYAEPPLDPEAAFRESLFDAMADDEGASYWEGVYGQPIHIYDTPDDPRGGDLERMSEEDYAAYVRQKMWEKTHQGIMEERARREARAKEQKAKDREKQYLREQTERQARKEDEERLRKRWERRFEEYIKRWEDIPTSTKPGTRPPSAETILPWPIDSGRREDISEGAVRAFFVKGLDLIGIGEAQFASRLKEERVRWHPDKIQQRLGGEVEDVVMGDVTAIFQVIDRMWAEARGAKG